MKQVLLVDCDSTRVPSLEVGLRQLGCDVKREKLFALPVVEEINRFPLVVISGGPHLLTNPLEAPRLYEAFAFLKPCTSAIFGICLGHQALGLASDAVVYRGQARRETEKVEWLLEGHPCFAGLETGWNFVTDHCEGITKPRDYDLIAASTAYPVEMMVHQTLPRVGVQFHPESSGAEGLALIKAVLDYLQAMKDKKL